jgi:molybdate transport system substrate-binding protein
MRLILLVLLLTSLPTQASELNIAAATNLRFVLPKLISQFNQQFPQHTINTSFAASGTLTSQIQHGAPFDIFLSASPDYIDRLEQSHHIKAMPITFAYGQLALFYKPELRLNNGMSDLASVLASSHIDKVVIANPMHAPYGELAKQQLEQVGLWQTIQSYLLTAESASQALQFSLSPQASIAFLPYSYVIQDKFSARGKAVKLDSIIQQQAVLVTKAKPEANDFIMFLTSRSANLILENNGYKVMP